MNTQVCGGTARSEQRRRLAEVVALRLGVTTTARRGQQPLLRTPEWCTRLRTFSTSEDVDETSVSWRTPQPPTSSPLRAVVEHSRPRSQLAPTSRSRPSSRPPPEKGRLRTDELDTAASARQWRWWSRPRSKTSRRRDCDRGSSSARAGSELMSST